MTRKSLPKYVYNDRGYLRFIRRSRGISVMMHEEAGTPEFWDHYNRLLKGKPAPAPVKKPRAPRKPRAPKVPKAEAPVEAAAEPAPAETVSEPKPEAAE